MLKTFSKIFFLKIDFRRTKWSQKSIKLSADSLEVTLQDSNKIFNVLHFFRFLLNNMQTLLMQKWPSEALKGLTRRVENAFTVKKWRFFKVEDTLAIMLPRKNTHLSHLSSALKTFQDHLPCLWDNSKKLDFSTWWIFLCVFSVVKFYYRKYTGKFRLHPPLGGGVHDFGHAPKSSFKK